MHFYFLKKGKKEYKHPRFLVIQILSRFNGPVSAEQN